MYIMLQVSISHPKTCLLKGFVNVSRRSCTQISKAYFSRRAANPVSELDRIYEDEVGQETSEDEDEEIEKSRLPMCVQCTNLKPYVPIYRYQYKT